MQTVHIDVEDQHLDTLLTIINNLKSGLVKGCSVSSSDDAFFHERQARLMQLREDIHSGKEPLYDFQSSIDTLIEEFEG